MYNEKAFKNHIFWMKVKRVFLILVFTVVGAFVGKLVSDLVINVFEFETSIALLLTAGTGKAIQDAYWKMALLRKVIVISKKLDNVSIVANDELDEMIDSLNEFEGIKQNVSKNDTTLRKTRLESQK